MIGISQLQFPSKDSSRLKFAGYFANFVALSILVNPANVLLTFATIFFRAEIKAFYVYREIKAAKHGEVTKKEYWDIFFKNNIIKLISFSLFSAFIIYLTFTTTFLLISLLATVPLTMLLISLQSELRPKNFNPFTLFRASINFFLEGIKENSRGMVNSFDVKLEHLLPHQLNDDIIENIDKLKDKYGEKIPEPKDIIENNEYKQFIEYIKSLYKCSDEDRGKVITFLNGFCSNNMEHSSDLTGGQILLLVLRACNDGNDESVTNKKEALITNLIKSQTFSRTERIPNICFTGNIYDMLISLQCIHPDPEIKFKPLRQMLISEAKNAAHEFIIEKLKKKKNYKEIFNALYKLQNNPEDRNSQKIVDDFIEEVSIPLMRELLSFSSGYTEQIVLTLMKNIGSIKFDMLEDFLLYRIRSKLKGHGLDNQENLLEKVKEKVFLKLLNEGLLSTQFFVGIFSHDDAKKIADKIIEEEVEEFKLKAEKAIEGQIISMLDGLRMLPKEKRCYRVYAELSKNNENDKEKIKKVLQEKLEITALEINEMLKKGASYRLELEVESVYEGNKDHVTQLYEKIREIKNEFIEDGLLTTQEIDKIVKERMITLNNDTRIMPSSNLSRSLSVSNLAMHHL